MYTASLIASLISSVLLIFTGIFVITKNRGSQSPVYYFQYNMAGSGILITLFLTYFFNESPHLTELNRLSQVFTILFSAAILNLSLTYPEREKRVPPYIPLALAGPALIISVLIYFTDLSISNVRFDNFILTRDTGPLYRVYSLVSFLYFVMSMVIFIRNYIKTRIETYRIQLRYVVLTTSAFIIMTYVGSIFLPLMYGNFDYYVLAPSATSFAATGALFYSVIAYNIMDIRTAVHKTAMYATLSASILLPIFLILHLTEKYTPGLPEEVIAGSAVLAFVLFSYLMQPGIDRVFKKRLADIDTITAKYIKKASRLKTFEDIAEASAVELKRGMGLDRVIFFIYDEEKRLFRSAYDTDKSDREYTVERYFPLIKWFARNQELLPKNRIYADEESFRNIRQEVAEFFESFNIGLILPFYYENRINGILCLGNRENLAPFSPDEIEKLEEYRNRASDFITSALAFDKAKKEQFIARSLGLSSDILYGSAAKALPEMKNIQFSSLIAPRYSKGIDYYDFLQPDKKTIGILCTDVSGIGINNALYSVVLRSVFHACINEAASPYIIMKRINLVLNEYTQGGGELATAFYAFFDSDSRRILYTNAGFPPMEVFRIEKNDFDSLDTAGSPLGYAPLSDFGHGRTELKNGDICIIYTRSLINSKNNSGDSFSLLRLRSAVKEAKSKSASLIAANLKKSYEEFMQQAVPDTDITVVIMKIL